MRGLYPRRQTPSSVSLPLRVKRSIFSHKGRREESVWLAHAIRATSTIINPPPL